MGKCKRHTAIILCCASFLINKPAYAFWPVLDFGEIIPIVSNVTTSLDSLSQTKSQLTELKNSLKAIGDSIDTISQFSQDLRNNLDDIADIANESAGIVNDNLGTNIDIQNGVTDVIDKVNNVQSGLVNNVVEQTQGALNQADGMADKATSGIDTAQKTGKDAEDLLNKAQEKTQKPNTDTEKSGSQGISGSSAPVSSQPEAVEEEEEEEEIPDINDMVALREEIKAGFAVARDENKKMAEQLNDVMDASVSALNKTTEESRLALEKLAQAVRDTDRLDKQDKEVLEKKIGEAAVRDLLPEKPEGEKRKVNFASIFGIDGVSTPQRKVSSFSLEHFKQLMVRDGLRFENEQEDLLVLYAITEEKNWTWYETYLLAKETAVNLVISTKRMRQKLTQQPQENGKDEFTPQERAIIREAKNKTSRQFLAGIKKARKAVVTQSERQAISDLAQLGLLDEVINVILLLTFNKVASANLNEKYALKVGNDFAYEGIKTAEEAVLKIRQRQDSHTQKAKEKATKSGQATGKTNVPKWSQPNYTNQTSQEEQANLEQQKRALLEKLNQGGE